MIKLGLYGCGGPIGDLAAENIMFDNNKDA